MIIVAETGLAVILLIILIIHLSVLFKWLPYSFIWGGKLQTDQEMYRFEAISILMTLIFFWVTLEKLNLVDILPDSYQRIALWIMAILFFFNTIGNLFSKNKIEKLVFTPLTILLTLFCTVLAIN